MRIFISSCYKCIHFEKMLGIENAISRRSEGSKFINKYLMLTKNQVSGKQQQCRCGWWSPPGVCYVNETAKPFSENEWDLQWRPALIGLTSTLADLSRLHASVYSPAACQKVLTVGSIIAPVWMQQIAQATMKSACFVCLINPSNIDWWSIICLGLCAWRLLFLLAGPLQSDRHRPTNVSPKLPFDKWICAPSS